MWIAIGAGIVAALVFMFVMFAVVPKVLLTRIQAKLERRVAEVVPRHDGAPIAPYIERRI